MLLSVPHTCGRKDRVTESSGDTPTASSSVLTRSKSFTLAGHSDGCRHAHPGLLSASSLHVFPRLQGKLVQGSKNREAHGNDS